VQQSDSLTGFLPNNSSWNYIGQCHLNGAAVKLNLTAKG
jgi:hypothetical protein